ncbi:hypothetical protein VNI00_001887 [Paramarasmius palmivorus]|uniref:G-patch domain-containing protein n=1 Tax=Paramarasmius palmivorus TaxID=297713 RepID=A0AAW0DZZ8_9AGAR
MSQATIARWNAIPLARPEQPESLKRPRPEDDDQDDDISIASRTPSPAPDAMDVDQDINKYDEHLRAPAREVVTVETKIKSTNKGFAMLAKLGWTEGQPLGLSADARVDPIPFQMKADSTGIGKNTQDVRMIESTVSQRRELDSERQQKETEQQRQAREDAVARRTALASEISDTLRAFYCTLCDKQFQNVAQYDEHTNSYAHHHKARAKDMQANMRLKPQEEIDKRKEKERKREEKELRKLAAASGIKISKQSSTQLSSLATPAASLESIGTNTSSGSGGWSSVTNTASSSSGFKKSGWATVGSSSSSITNPGPAPPEPAPPVQSPPPPPPAAIVQPTSSGSAATSQHMPAFRTGGWTSLETSASSTALSTPLPPAPQPPLLADNTQQAPVPNSKPQVASTNTTKSSAKSSDPGRGWQQFQKKNAKRR